MEWMKRKWNWAVAGLFAWLSMSPKVYASHVDEIKSTTVVQGFVQLLKDATFVVIFVAPLGGIALVAYQLLRKNFGEEDDAKIANKKIKKIIITTAIILSVDVLGHLVLKYFTPSGINTAG